MVRLEQKNDTFIDMGIYEDGPFEAGSEGEKNPDLVPAPANSYLGKSLLSDLLIRSSYTISSQAYSYTFASASQASLLTRGRIWSRRAF